MYILQFLENTHSDICVSLISMTVRWNETTVKVFYYFIKMMLLKNDIALIGFGWHSYKKSILQIFCHNDVIKSMVV